MYWYYLFDLILITVEYFIIADNLLSILLLSRNTWKLFKELIYL